MFYVLRFYRGSDPVPLAASTPLQWDAVEFALGDLSLGFRALGAEVRMGPPVPPPVGEELTLDVAMPPHFKLSITVQPAGQPALRASRAAVPPPPTYATKPQRWTW